jgi:hypothetical protein
MMTELLPLAVPLCRRTARLSPGGDGAGHRVQQEQPE